METAEEMGWFGVSLAQALTTNTPTAGASLSERITIDLSLSCSAQSKREY
jgi:hypothetical protein